MCQWTTSRRASTRTPLGAQYSCMYVPSCLTHHDHRRLIGLVTDFCRARWPSNMVIASYISWSRSWCVGLCLLTMVRWITRAAYRCSYPASGPLSALVWRPSVLLVYSKDSVRLHCKGLHYQCFLCLPCDVLNGVLEQPCCDHNWTTILVSVPLIRVASNVGKNICSSLQCSRAWHTDVHVEPLRGGRLHIVSLTLPYFESYASVVH